MAPWKCPDCGTWWSGLEHRCPPIQTWSGKITNAPPASFTVTCNCTWHDGVRVSTPYPCPIHDVQVTYTGWGGA